MFFRVDPKVLKTSFDIQYYTQKIHSKISEEYTTLKSN